MLAPSETSPQVHRRKWLWSSLAALIAICGGLGFLEGRAQSTHAFRGPVQIVRDQYNQLRARLTKSSEAPATAPASSDTVTEKQLTPPTKPATAEKAADPQPDSSTNANPSANEPASTTVPLQQTTQPVAKQPDAATNATPTTETAKAEPAKPIESPPPKPSTKPQPGQQELNKAIDASDPAAAAAWLWKSTSRGNPEAPIRLADMYIKGKGVPKSCEQALVLLRSAAIKENAPARNRLAALYANGTCVARDRVKAYQLMSSALVADPSSEWAQQNRKEMWNQMSPEERAEAEKYR